MKRILLIALLAFVAWRGYRYFAEGPAPVAGLAAPQTAAVASVAPGAAPAFKCDGRQHCSQMNSRAEAEFFVRNCPDTKMDGDHDGEPCENDSRF